MFNFEQLEVSLIRSLDAQKLSLLLEEVYVEPLMHKKPIDFYLSERCKLLSFCEKSVMDQIVTMAETQEEMKNLLLDFEPWKLL